MEYYTYILAFHVVSIISWMAMLFYLPRLFVYHQEYNVKKDFTDIVKIQEYKLYKYIGAPAMWATIFSGGYMIYLNSALLETSWFTLKLLIVGLLIAYSLSLETYRKQLENDTCNKDGKFFRAYNEVPTILSILVVTFVITKSIPIIFSIGITLFFIFIMYMIIKPSS